MGWKADIIGSLRAFPLLTQLRHQPRRMAMLSMVVSASVSFGDRKILFVNPAHCGVHQIDGRDERVPSARTTARTRSYGRASSTMLKGPCAARRTWRKPPPSFSTSVNFASPAWAPRPSPTSCASDVGTQIMVEAL